MRFALAAILLLAQGAPTEDAIRKIVPDADKIKKLFRKVPPASREKIEKALGEKIQDSDLEPALWECSSIVPGVSTVDRTKCVVAIVSLKGPKGPVRIGVAAALPENILHAVRILENGDDKGLESKHFISQFQGLEVTASLWSPPDALTQAIQKGAGGKDDDAKQLQAVLRTNSLMRATGPSWARLAERTEKREKGAADELAPLEKAIDESVKLLPAAKFLGASSQDKFRKYAADTRSDLSAIRSLLAGGKFEEAQRKIGETDSARCSRCHGAYRRKFRDARLAAGVGDGYFSTRLDVALPDPKLEPSAQAVATAIRKALLLATEAK